MPPVDAVVGGFEGRALGEVAVADMARGGGGWLEQER